MSSTDLEQRVPTGTLIQKVGGDEFTRDQIRQALPPSVSLDRFARSTITALMQSPDLAKADEASLFQSIVKCATDGLLPDGREAALVIYKGKVSYLPMIAGVRKIAAEYGWTIHTHVIYANDQFEIDLGAGLPIHRPAALSGERGDMIGAWAKATHRDGRAPLVEVMRAEDIAKAKAVAQTDRVWKQWPAQMWEKTVGHRIAKKLPLDPVDAERLNRVLTASALEPGGAAEMLYGPGGIARSEFGKQASGVIEMAPTQDPPATQSPADEPTDQPVPPGPSGGVTGEEAATEAQGDDPSSSQGADGATVAASEPTEDQIVEWMEASLYVPPAGAYADPTKLPADAKGGGEEGPKSLGEIHALGKEGIDYLEMCLRKLPEGDWRVKTERFCLVAMPAEYTAALAKKAA